MDMTSLIQLFNVQTHVTWASSLVRVSQPNFLSCIAVGFPPNQRKSSQVLFLSLSSSWTLTDEHGSFSLSFSYFSNEASSYLNVVFLYFHSLAWWSIQSDGCFLNLLMKLQLSFMLFFLIGVILLGCLYFLNYYSESFQISD